MRAPTIALNRAYVRACRNSGKTHQELAAFGSFGHRCQLTAILLAGKVRHTDLMVARLQQIADAIGYTGPVFR